MYLIQYQINSTLGDLLIIFRLQFPLLNDTLNYLNVGIIGQIKRVKRNKYNLFIFHMLLQECECINDEDINLALLDEPVLPL